MTSTRRWMALLVVLVGSGLMLWAADGDLDVTFDADGKVTTDFYGPYLWDVGSAIARQDDGKLVVAGTADYVDADFNFFSNIALARYNTDGSLDTSFGSDGTGKVRLAFRPGYTPAEREGVDVVIQPDGAIVVAGTVYALDSGDFTTTVFGVARLLANGTLDASFGTGGYVKTDFAQVGDAFASPSGGASVALQADGNIVVAGFVALNGGPYDFALVRYDMAGNPDGTFGSGGKVTLDFYGRRDWANGVAIQPSDGAIIAVGSAEEMVALFTYHRYAATARFSAVDGSLDTTFAGTGWTTLDFSPANPYEHWNDGNAVVVQGDGKIVIGGNAFVNTLSAASLYDFALARYTAGGALDSTFDGDGIALTDFVGGLDIARDLAIQQDGKIVAVGTVTEYDGTGTSLELTRDFGLARYSGVDGSLDTTFGAASTGKVITAFDGLDGAQSVVLQPDCRIVAAGYSTLVDYGDSSFALARYDGGVCSVPPPSYWCPVSFGHWKNDPTWPVATLTLGSQLYTEAELRAILTSSRKKDASLILAQQLIAAKLNIANGSDPTPVAATIADADALLAGFVGKLPYGVPSSSDTGQLMVADATVLTNYNQGLLTPDCLP